MLARIFCATVVFAALLLAVCAQATDKETILYNFNDNSESTVNPWGGLMEDQAGNFYGVALPGTLFELSATDSGTWKYTELYACNYDPDCSYPFGSLAMDEAGNLYTSTYFGNVLEYSPGGSSGWSVTTLSSLNAPSPVILDSAGDLYGVTAGGGANGMGEVFELSPSSGASWALTNLHDFKGSDGAGNNSNDSDGQIGGLIMDSAGNLYGVTGGGGSSTKCASGCGVVFELSKNNSGAWTETVLHTFTRKDGYNPDASLFMDANGNLYGTTASGGSGGYGTVFETSQVSGKWQTHDLYSFTSHVHDGAYPNTALIMDDSGNLYGTTISGGGSYGCSVGGTTLDTGCGTAFELSPSGSGWTETILQDFSGGGNGAFPGGLIFGPGGNLYGITDGGGHAGVGNFIELSPASAKAEK
ncbi:MAG: choice-of-anchor tandem repeat GloVer-containing protein [Candidatus Sulfotelmatobacter sp.]